MKLSILLPALLVAGYVGEVFAALDDLSAMFAGREPNRCPPGDIRCVDGRCILKKWRCDGQKDCRDGSDEDHCPMPTCSPHQHLCDSRRCIPIEWRCDGRKDCADGSDELESNCKKPCPESFWKCQGSQMCIPVHWKCDKEKDCRDGEDEDKEACAVLVKCPKNELMCDNKQQCISTKLWCDGYLDCTDFSDERNAECLARTTTQAPPCQGKEFRCNNGRCLPSQWACDGAVDCEHGEDENTPDCPKTGGSRTGGGYMAGAKQSETMASADFMRSLHPLFHSAFGVETDSETQSTKCSSIGDSECRNGECIPAAWWCDGSPDCEDGSDETSCKDRGASQNNPSLSETITVMSCDSDSLFCVAHNKTTGICLPLSRWCDHHVDCHNATDEGFECDKVCKNNGQCSHDCNATPMGPKCSCPEGFVLSADGKACEDVDECGTLGGPCSQGCVNTKGSFKCECGFGFAMGKDGLTCKTEDPSPVLFYSADGQLRSVSAEGEFQHQAVLESNITRMAVGLDWAHPTSTEHGSIFFSDIEKSKIYCINSVTHKSTIILDNVAVPEGVAYDWTSGNLYYIDADKPEIGVCAVRQPSSYCNRIIHNDVDRVRGLALHPGKRMLFFAKWGDGAKIERTWLDGSGRQDVLSYKLRWPNALVVDYIWERLYFIDASLDWLESVGYNGEDRRVVHHMKGAHPFGLTILGNRVFWTDWNYRAINSVLTNGSDFRPVATTRTKPMGIVAVHPSRQIRFETPCAPEKNPCAQICLAKPGNLYTCMCHTNYYLAYDTKCFISNGAVHQEQKSGEVSYSATSVAGIICACLLCVTLLAVVVVYSRKYFLGLRVDDEKSLLDYDTESPRKKGGNELSSIGTGSPNPCYENFPPPSYVVKFHKYQNIHTPEQPLSPASFLEA